MAVLLVHTSLPSVPILSVPQLLRSGFMLTTTADPLDVLVTAPASTADPLAAAASPPAPCHSAIARLVAGELRINPS
jgi:hypothetical protein